MFKRISSVVTTFVGIVFLFNASFLSKSPEGDLKILSHRGVHQTMLSRFFGNRSCFGASRKPNDGLESAVDLTVAGLPGGFRRSNHAAVLHRGRSSPAYSRCLAACRSYGCLGPVRGEG